MEIRGISIIFYSIMFLHLIFLFFKEFSVLSGMAHTQTTQTYDYPLKDCYLCPCGHLGRVGLALHSLVCKYLAIWMNEQNPVSEYQNIHIVEHKLEPRNMDSQTSAFYFLKLLHVPGSLRKLIKNEVPPSIPGDCFRNLTSFLPAFVYWRKSCLPCRALGTIGAMA